MRGWPALAWLTAVLVLVAAVAVAVGVDALRWPDASGPVPGASSSVPAQGGASSPVPAQSGAPEAIATSDGPFRAGPVAPPASGAYLGAWVRPAQLTQSGRIEAVAAWERALGRRLDLVNTYRRMEDPFFTPSDSAFAQRGATVMVSWAAGDTRSITSGQYDDVIRQRAREAKAWGRPVLLRFRWEMDRPNLQASMWSPADYVAAWQYTRAIFRAEGATNVSWVWCPTAEGFTGGYAPAYYPGDADVDWACVDVYAGAKLVRLGPSLRSFLRWGAAHPTKPLMLGEFGVARVWPAQQRADWLTDAAAVVRANPQVRAALYFESNPDNATGPQQEFRLADDPTAMAAFQALASEPYFNPRS